jgi:hypothetical protein
VDGVDCVAEVTRADLAVQYATRGWSVFPLKQGGKEPGTRSGFYAGTTDLVTVRGWWRQRDWNIGIWTGASNLVVVDLDIDKEDAASWCHGGPTPGITWWTDVCEVAGYDFKETYCVATWSGGLHVYFTSEKPYPPQTGKFGALVDIRAGLSYVVAAGSEVQGAEFEHCGSDQIAEVPDWLDALIDPLPVKQTSPLEQYQRDKSGGFNSAVEGLTRVLLESVEGERNNTLNWCVAKVGQHWWDENQREHAVDRLRAIATAHDLTEREVEDTIKSARRSWPPR